MQAVSGTASQDLNDHRGRVATGAFRNLVLPFPFLNKKKKKLKKVTINGMDVDLCCPGCLKKYNKADDKFALIFSDKGYEKGFSSKESKKTKSASK